MLYLLMLFRPELSIFPEWEDTCITVHMWTQIAGKIRLELSPWINHSWGSALYVTANGLGTSPIPYKEITFSIEFNFTEHKLQICTSGGKTRSFKLKPMTVADFYQKVMQNLKELGIEVQILARPVEVEEAIPFEEDTIHNSYDSAAMNRYWNALVQADRVFNEFRAGFIGKSSPVHFFRGAFDLAVTRFSGKTAPKHPGGAPNCADWVMEEAYSHELSSAGFWPGTGLGEAAFYSYTYPEPEGYQSAIIEPGAATYLKEMGEYILPYDAVQTSDDPDAVLLSFLQSGYEAGANAAGWNMKALEGIKLKELK